MSAITDFVGRFDSAEQSKGPRLRVKKKRSTLTPLEVALADARRRAVTGEWGGSKGRTFVGLHAMCHRMVYGVVPSELEQLSLFNAAAKMAAKAMHELFADDPEAFAAFVRWSWEVEKRKNTWAQSKSIDRRRLGWRAQFSRSLETDYRIDLKRRR